MPGRQSKSSFCDDCCPKVCLSTVFLEVLRGHEITLITWLLIQQPALISYDPVTVLN